ncbi:MAG: hypothetical protein WKF59_13775 [Chitinophagaceae bacterium]
MLRMCINPPNLPKGRLTDASQIFVEYRLNINMSVEKQNKDSMPGLPLYGRGTESEAILSPIEKIKTESNGLRGTIKESLHDEITGAIREDDQALIKFHGMYQQDDRDRREERAEKNLIACTVL